MFLIDEQPLENRFWLIVCRLLVVLPEALNYRCSCEWLNRVALAWKWGICSDTFQQGDNIQRSYTGVVDHVLHMKT